MINSIHACLTTLKAVAVKGEDGQSIQLECNSGVPESQIHLYEQDRSYHLPEQLRQLLMSSNGMSLFGHEIMSIEQLVWHCKHGLICFHNWGNGDFDCIALSNRRFPDGTVVFMNHSPEIIVKIADSLAQWLQDATAEIVRQGTLLHPSDYRYRTSGGLYQHVLKELRGVHCELNG